LGHLSPGLLTSSNSSLVNGSDLELEAQVRSSIIDGDLKIISETNLLDIWVLKPQLESQNAMSNGIEMVCEMTARNLIGR
jgi:hypothetical protein